MSRTKTLYHVSPENVDRLMPRYSPKHKAKGIFVASSIAPIKNSWAAWAAQKGKAPKYAKDGDRHQRGQYKTLTLYKLTLPERFYQEALKRHWQSYEDRKTENPEGAGYGAWFWDEEVFIPEDLMGNLKIIGKKTDSAAAHFGHAGIQRDRQVPPDLKLVSPRNLLEKNIEDLKKSFKLLSRHELEKIKDNLIDADLSTIPVKDPLWDPTKYEKHGVDIRWAKHQNVKARMAFAYEKLEEQRDEIVALIDKQLKSMREDISSNLSVKQLVFENCVLENREVLVEEDLEEVAEYPEGFDIEHFKSISSFKERIAYARERLGRIGAGSSRIVMDADANHVIKIAKNAKGIAQNSTEADVSRMGSDIIAKVVDHDDEYFYLEAERASKMTPATWKTLTGWTYDEWMNVFANYMDKQKGRRSARRVPDDFEDIEETDLFQELVNLSSNFDMPVGDLARISSWGVVIRNGTRVPVLIDYGLTESVYRDFYYRPPSGRHYR